MSSERKSSAGLDIPDPANAIEVVSISEIVRNKRILSIVPNAIRIVAGLILALISATIIFGMLLRVAAIFVFLIGVVHERTFALMLIPMLLFSLLIYVVAAWFPFWMLSRVDNDSIIAIGICIFLCGLGGYFIIRFDSDVDGLNLGWRIVLAAMILAIVNFVVQGAYLIHLRRSRLAPAVMRPRASSRFLRATLLPKSILLFSKAVAIFALRMLKILAIGSLVWVPLFLLSLVIPAISTLILLVIFIGKRRKIANTILCEFRLVRSRLQRSAGELRALDHRRPVLFLRSYVDDTVATRNFAGRVASVILGLDIDEMRLEECAVDTIRKLGPVIALNRPGSDLPELGAAKENAKGDWKEVVSTYLEQSQVVIVMYGTGEGLQWEIAEILRKGFAGKLILVAPPKPDIDSLTVISAFLGQSGVEANLSHGERVLAVTRGESSGRVHAVTSKFDDTLSYALAIKYCANISSAAPRA